MYPYHEGFDMALYIDDRAGGNLLEQPTYISWAVNQVRQIYVDDPANPGEQKT